MRDCPGNLHWPFLSRIWPDMPFLEKSQVQLFHEQGFLTLEGVIGEQWISDIRVAAGRIVDAFDSDKHRSVFSTRDRDEGRDRYFYESSEQAHCFLEEDAMDPNGALLKPKHLAINKIGHAMHDLVPEFTAFCRQPIFGQILRELGQKDPLLWQTMYIFKQPHIGGEVRWHQDGSYLITQPPSVVGIWVALEDANRDNGCLWMQPGGHSTPLRERFEAHAPSATAELKSLDRTPWPSEEQTVPLEVSAGSIVLFQDRMPHYSSRNNSDASRHAFTMHCAPADVEWSGLNWLQRPTLAPFRL
jgi:phytanoyl-CoA hydroxylase